MIRGRILVTGATGALGPATVRALAQAGFEVLALVRRPDVPVPAGIESRAGDLADRTSLDRAVYGVDAVVHLGALHHIVNPPPELRAT